MHLLIVPIAATLFMICVWYGKDWMIIWSLLLLYAAYMALLVL